MPNLRDDEYEPSSGYQDDLTIDDGSRDPAIDELTDDPTEGFGVPDDEYAAELEKLAVDIDDSDADAEHEDFREHLEGMNKDGDDESKAA